MTHHQTPSSAPCEGTPGEGHRAATGDGQTSPVAARTNLPDCGTPKGYNRHRTNGEDACRPCKDARNAYVKANPNNGSYQTARQRALARLAQAHPGEYAALLAEERAKETGQ